MKKKDKQPRSIRTLFPIDGQPSLAPSGQSSEIRPPQYYGYPEMPAFIPPLPGPLIETGPNVGDLFDNVGDLFNKVGYVDHIRFNFKDQGSVPSPFRSSATRDDANRYVEEITCFVVSVSDNMNSSSNIIDFRLLYRSLAGEPLARSLAMVVALKDAFLHRTKVRVRGELSQSVIFNYLRQAFPSDSFWMLNSAELLRA